MKGKNRCEISVGVMVAISRSQVGKQEYSENKPYLGNIGRNFVNFPYPRGGFPKC